jgi:hypothetical protein
LDATPPGVRPFVVCCEIAVDVRLALERGAIVLQFARGIEKVAARSNIVLP